MDGKSAGVVTFAGPNLEHHDVVVGGWEVPLLQAFPDDAGRVSIVLDHRIAAPVLTLAQAELFVPFLADSIAVALGYGSHPGGVEELPPVLPHVRPRRVLDMGEISPG